MKKILVTGGAGFIGSHTCILLLKKGYKLYVIDSYFNSSPRSLQNVLKICKEFNPFLKIFEGDLRNKTFVKNVFEDAKSSDGIKISAVIHFAGLKSVSDSVNDPLNYWQVNLIGTINLLEAMDQYNCKTIVFSSSAAVYGRSDKKLISEDHDVRPINPYGQTKATIEKILFDLFNSDSMNWKIANLRYFNPIGAHQSGLIGEDPKEIPNNIFPIINRVAMRKLKKVNIFGNDWPTFDGTGIRDYIHVMDLAEGHLAVLEYLFNQNCQCININLGTGQGTSVLELINIFQTVNNVQVPFEFGEKRKGDLPCVIADNSLALKILDWEPKRDIYMMCRDGWSWQISNKS